MESVLRRRSPENKEDFPVSPVLENVPFRMKK